MSLLDKNLDQIRQYTRQHKELNKAHHFLYDCPVNKNVEGTDVVIIGNNPGETEEDWAYKGILPTEESREFDFHEAAGRSRSAIKWSQLTWDYLKINKIALSNLFFWSGPQSGEDPNKGVRFSERFGYKFKDCPHLGFCKAQNIDLINYHQPKLIAAPGIGYSELVADIYDLDHVQTYKIANNRRTLAHYDLNGIPFIFTLHWSGARPSRQEKKFIQDYLSNYLD